MQRLFKPFQLIFALGAIMLLASCGEDEPKKEEEITFETNPDAFCAANPFDGQCCLPKYDVDCYCSEGTNATDDTENCCLFNYNPTCFCEANPEDAQCSQNFGVDSGLGVIFDFENTAEPPADLFDPAQLAQYDGDGSITAIEGNHYYSLAVDLSDPDNPGWSDFKYWPSKMDDNPDNDGEAQIDLSGLANPHLNFWVNSGQDSLAITVAFRVNDQDYDKDYLFKAGTAGEWKLFSMDLSDVTFRTNYGDPTGKINELVPEMKFQMLKVVFRSATWVFADPDNTRYNANIDAISITDGPIEQLPWVK
ncbi:hypothetical protein C7460_11857 [Marinoscillum furvescens DSM 4134]|uniref:Uncharacterized protein n=2 Tax=Marinoscillum furvescens TaxID=1026 RepID=A0A3D9KZ14_MARFU|nr:hypothetical protein C7460_11857 [Marinoscillum furvescens DSM 4134]